MAGLGDELLEEQLVDGPGHVGRGLEGGELPGARLAVEVGVDEAQLPRGGLVGGAVLPPPGVPVDVEVEAEEPEVGRPAVAAARAGGLVIEEGLPGEFGVPQGGRKVGFRVFEGHFSFLWGLFWSSGPRGGPKSGSSPLPVADRELDESPAALFMTRDRGPAEVRQPSFWKRSSRGCFWEGVRHFPAAPGPRSEPRELPGGWDR